METLNAMTFKLLNKTMAEYVGELLIISADDYLYDSLTQTFKWFEDGDLINIDTENKWRNDTKAKW